MTREDAYYYKILLSNGFDDGYYEWLDGFLEEEDPLSDIVLELSLCGSNVNETIRLLHNYCAEEEFDDGAVGERIRLFLRDGFSSGRFTKDEVISLMYNIAMPCIEHEGLEAKIWCDMFYMDDYYSMAGGILASKKFDRMFHDFLNDGKPIGDPLAELKGKKTWFDRLKEIIKSIFS